MLVRELATRNRARGAAKAGGEYGLIAIRLFTLQCTNFPLFQVGQSVSIAGLPLGLGSFGKMGDARIRFCGSEDRKSGFLNSFCW